MLLNFGINWVKCNFPKKKWPNPTNSLLHPVIMEIFLICLSLYFFQLCPRDRKDFFCSFFCQTIFWGIKKYSQLSNGWQRLHIVDESANKRYNHQLINRPSSHNFVREAWFTWEINAYLICANLIELLHADSKFGQKKGASFAPCKLGLKGGFVGDTHHSSKFGSSNRMWWSSQVCCFEHLITLIWLTL